MSKKGYKPYSHEATISFVKEFHSKEFTAEETTDFDHFRKLRHDSVYRAVPVLLEDARDCIAFAKKFVKKAREI
jgi:uncharacterized protein (UPF0332 family)